MTQNEDDKEAQTAHSLSQVRERCGEFYFAAGFQHGAVCYDHAIEIPFENFCDGFARGLAVANHLFELGDGVRNGRVRRQACRKFAHL